MPIDVKGRRPTVKERPRRCFIISKRKRKRCADEFLSYGDAKGSLLPIAAVRFGTYTVAIECEGNVRIAGLGPFWGHFSYVVLPLNIKL